jgi:flagellar biogenesis protein FliO
MSCVDVNFFVPRPPRGGSPFWKILVLVALLLLERVCHAEATNTVAAALTPALPDASFSVLRVFGSLILVVALFLAGVWLFRNWQRLAARQGRAPRLNILESRSIGGRQSLFVVGYDQQRFLVSSSPAGVQMLTPLPDAHAEEVSQPIPTHSFAQAFEKVLAAKS